MLSTAQPSTWAKVSFQQPIADGGGLVLPSKRYAWVDVPPTPITPTNPRLIITHAIGAAWESLLALTGPLMRNYAARCGADFMVLSTRTQEWWGHEKFRIREFARQYERTLYLDADVLVRPSCPNLFDFVPIGTVAAHNDWPYLTTVDWLKAEHALLMKSLEIEYPVCRRALNAGLMLFDRAHADIWSPHPGPIPGNHCDEQMWVDDNIERAGIPVTLLPTQYNHQFWMGEYFTDPRNLAAAQIVHLAACSPETRLRLAKQLITGWERRT